MKSIQQFYDPHLCQVHAQVSSNSLCNNSFERKHFECRLSWLGSCRSACTNLSDSVSLRSTRRTTCSGVPALFLLNANKFGHKSLDEKFKVSSIPFVWPSRVSQYHMPSFSLGIPHKHGIHQEGYFLNSQKLHTERDVVGAVDLDEPQCSRRFLDSIAHFGQFWADFEAFWAHSTRFWLIQNVFEPSYCAFKVIERSKLEHWRAVTPPNPNACEVAWASNRHWLCRNAKVFRLCRTES